jgi:hypothetical protein
MAEKAQHDPQDPWFLIPVKGGPIIITNLGIINALDVVAGLSNDGSEVLLGKILIGHGGKLV